MTNKKLEKLEAIIEITMKMMVKIQQLKAQQDEEGFVNPFGFQKKKKPKEGRSKEGLETRSLQHRKFETSKVRRR